ncbi:MAG: energy transducer TonB [Chthoniobacterales bacterium]
MNYRIQFFAAIALLWLLSVPATAETLPEFRPALLGSFSRSLINTINTESLVKRGQGDAVVMFTAGISESGYGHIWETYRGTPGSDLLSKEIMDRASQAQFEAAVYKHQHVGVILNGTVAFSVVGGKPHLRIFLHQEESDLKQGKDFVAPQLAFATGNPKFEGIWYPGHTLTTPGVAAVTLEVDANGKVQNAVLAYEHPAGKGFGAETVDALRKAVFIPGFRNGKAVPCKFTYSVIFSGTSRRPKTG